MSKEYVVQKGDCVASLAFDYGLHPRTLWNHPNNSKLKQQRQEGTVLNEGDVIFIPDRSLKEVDKPTDATHKFVRKGIPEIVRLRFLDEYDKPRAGLRYILFIDGESREGKTDSEGAIKGFISPNAKAGRIILYDKSGEPEEYVLKLGHLPPITELTGIQERLSSLGYFCKTDSGEFGEMTRDCIRRFQTEHNLTSSGELDEQTRTTIKNLYGA